jgi:anion-transporting  ArsA/GET3 family ATPase
MVKSNDRIRASPLASLGQLGHRRFLLFFGGTIARLLFNGQLRANALPIQNVRLSEIIDSRRIILCVGSGGVGKTTVSAALGLLAAKKGRRTLCLTIDPARRLAQSLGFEEFRVEAQEISAEKFKEAGIDASGSLTVMMLDTKRTFDEIVERYASSPEVRDRILQNRIYHYVSTALAGTQEYMAMEKLYAVKQDQSLDTIILDTPPTSNALDFLDAPERLMAALDSSASRWFIRAFRSTGRLSLDLLARSAAIAMRGMGRLTGTGFLEQIAEFLTDLNDLFGGFAHRAQKVQRALRAPDVAYVLVTSPAPMAIQEAIYFSERLAELGMSSDGIVVNRIHLSPNGTAEPEPLRDALERSGLSYDDDLVLRLQTAMGDEATLAARDALHLRLLDEDPLLGDSKLARANIPAYPHDVHDLESLDKVACILAQGEIRSMDEDPCDPGLHPVE